LLSRLKASSGSKRSENDANNDFDKISSGSNLLDLNNAKKIMRNNLSKVEKSKAKINYKDIIRKQRIKTKTPDEQDSIMNNSEEQMKMNIEYNKIKNEKESLHAILGSSRTPQIGSNKGVSINQTALSNK